MTIPEVNKLMFEKESLVFLNEDLKEIKITFDYPEEFIEKALKIAESRYTYIESVLNQTEIEFDYYQCIAGKNRSIHDLYLLYRHYCQDPITFAEFNICAYNYCCNNTTGHIFFRCSTISNLVITNKYGGNNQYDNRDKFGYMIRDYINYKVTE